MTLVHTALFVTSLLGFIALALAMPGHCRHVLRRTLPVSWCRLLRILGWALLALGLGLAVWQWPYGIGIATWLGWLSIAGMTLVFNLPHWPWRPIAPERPARRIAKVGAKNEEAFDEASDITGQRPALHAALIAGLLLMPVGGFAVQLWRAPEKPLLREDALHGEIGPWSFVLAEKDRKPPTIEALDTPLKEFVIRFCEGCDAEIRMAHLKMRKPHSLRAAGNGFTGRRQEKSATVPVPPAAALEDGLWLTVEGINGEVYQQRLDIQQLSPALADFVRART